MAAVVTGSGGQLATALSVCVRAFYAPDVYILTSECLAFLSCFVCLLVGFERGRFGCVVSVWLGNCVALHFCISSK